MPIVVHICCTLSRDLCGSFLCLVPVLRRQLHTITANMSGMLEGVNLADRPLPTTLPLDRNLGDGLAIMTWVMLAISTVLIAARMVSKIMILRRFRTDDVFLLFTWVSLHPTPALYRSCYANAPSGWCCCVFSHDSTRISQRLRSTLA